jgi:hypothetical protein
VQDGNKRAWDRGIEHVPVGLGEGTRHHEGGYVRMKVVVMGQAHVA